jgi:carboxyl-terminal processing protease
MLRSPVLISGPALAALLAAAAAGASAQQPGSPQPSAYEELQTFSAVLNHIRVNYVDSVTYTQLVRAAIDGVLRSLDPHSRFESHSDHDKAGKLERGDLAITGLVLEDVDGAASVLAVLPRSPAEKAGIQPGDRLVLVNDTTVAGLGSSALELKLAGEKGSKVRLRLERGPRLDPDTFTVTLKRDFVREPSVSIARLVDPVTGYVRLDEFGEKAASEVHDALRQLRGQGARQFLLDLRRNPGGVVIAAVEIASEFFPKKTVVFRTQGRKKDVDTTFVTKRDGEFADVPLIVLIDGGSASASEALAASLQDHDRALLLGRRSFGKALMQVAFLTPSGDIVWLTVGRVITPSGRFIQRRYRGLRYEEYRAFGGVAGAGEDTLETFHTDRGRPVRGGGGIAPDVELPRPAAVPVWWSAAADSGFDAAIADSLASTLPATPAARATWVNARAEWDAKLVGPFLERVRSRFHVAAQPDSSLRARIARNLAVRVTEVRWGPDARVEFLVRNDPDVRAAVEYFPRLPELLSPPR